MMQAVQAVLVAVAPPCIIFLNSVYTFHWMQSNTTPYPNNINSLLLTIDLGSEFWF